MTTPKPSGPARHFRISGRVQGVSYRANTQDKARELGLAGWVRNCADGRVEALACGDADALDAFEAWLWQGPQLAEVSQVEARDADPSEGDGKDFVIR
ncbi:acylphosphatase [Marinimicrobium sp. C2-29]|uniref:acylphosphatase n=1 Tax=Marinimicrobium sp. C2-29 TaxID=3139825 RepID=UPI003138625B